MELIRNFISKYPLNACIRTSFCLLLSLAILVVSLSRGHAACVYCGGPTCVDCGKVSSESAETRSVSGDDTALTNEWIDMEFDIWEDWLINNFPQPFKKPLYDLAEQMTVTAVYQVFVIGTLLDAKQELESQRLLQKKMADLRRDYQPSQGICIAGTTIRSLADSEPYVEATAFVLSQRAQDRQIGNMHAAAAGGGENDKKSRLEQLRRRYCDGHDHGNMWAAVCTGGGGATVNKDIDYTRTVEAYRTLDIDFTDGALTDDEEDVMALASNLYSHDVFDRVEEKLYNGATPERGGDKLRLLLEQRSIIAKRSVAENSYNAIVGLKSLGSPAVEPPDPLIGDSNDTSRYLRVILEQLGMSANDIDLYFGERPIYDPPSPPDEPVRPSYFAQMEVVTKKIFQQPAFFSELNDKPANVDRKNVALQAVALMQDFDMWQSYLRTEAMLSVMLELEVERYQAAAENLVTGEYK